MIHFYEPRSLLEPLNYLASLAALPRAQAIAACVVGMALALLGLPLRRFSAAICLAALAYALTAVAAFHFHAPFVLWTSMATFAAVALGVFLPRFAHALWVAALLALLARAVVITIEPAFDLYAAAGGFALGMIAMLLIWQSGVVLMTSMLGGLLVGGSFHVFGFDWSVASMTTAQWLSGFAVFGVGLFAQFRIGELGRVRG